MQIKVSQTVYHCMSWKELLGTYKQNILLNYPTWQLVDAPKLHPPYHMKISVYSVYSLPNSLLLIQLLVLGPWFFVDIEEERGVILQIYPRQGYCNSSDRVKSIATFLILFSEWIEYCYNQRGTAKTIRTVQYRKKNFQIALWAQNGEQSTCGLVYDSTY